jgi:frataxin-like iron-binding protein CyaY
MTQTGRPHAADRHLSTTAIRCINSNTKTIAPIVSSTPSVPLFCRAHLVASPLRRGLLARSFCQAKPVSRRKAAAKAEPTESDIEQFKKNGVRLFETVKRAIDPILPLNKSYMLVVRSEEEMELIAGDRGSYIFRLDDKSQRLTLLSPMSGCQQYSFDGEEKLWLSTQDRHDFRGLLTRDLLRHSAGCPQFD